MYLMFCFELMIMVTRNCNSEFDIEKTTDKISFLSWIDDSVNQPVSRRLPFSLMVDLHLPTQTFETYLISLMQCKVKLDRLTTTNFSIDVFS